MIESLSGRLRIINYLLILLISIAILFLIRNIVNLFTLKIDSRVIDTRDTTKSEIRQDTVDINSYAIILEKNPFGNPMRLQPLIGTQITEGDTGAPPDIILIGTAVGPRRMSYAVFELSDGKGQEVFKIGEDVFNHGTLTSIERDLVSLQKGNDKITIKMIDINSTTETSQLRSEGSTDSFVRKISEKDYLINREKVEQSLENPQQILTDARLLPNIQNGKQEGFKVLEVRPGGLYENLGLRNGDILLRINGIDISSPDVAIQAMSAFKGMNRVNLDIMRDGNKLSMNYQIR